MNADSTVEDPVEAGDAAGDMGEPLKVERRFGDEASRRTTPAGPAGQQARITTLLVRDGDWPSAAWRAPPTVPRRPGSPPRCLAPAKFPGMPVG
ncbi:hypothetical protein [Streptomyces sp. NPDC029721]|uniref:hypothetical protein n=1 Tax=Streptomyces sp. NPDC029721 TaxID=3157090 RepID=UPI0033F88430